MAKKNYLIKGLSGTGKSTVCKELQERGYEAVEADQEFGFYDGEKEFLNFKWDKSKVEKFLNNSEKDIAFVCGGSMNDKEFLHLFSKVFTLHVDNETLTHRLLNRPDGNWVNRPQDLARLLEWNEGNSRRKDLIFIDSSSPAEKVVDSILENTQ